MLLNRAKVNTATATDGTMTLGAAVASFLTWAGANATDGQPYRYLIEDGTAWELGTGTYAAGADTLTRPGPGVDSTFESSTGALLVLSGTAVVSCVALVADYTAMSSGGGGGGTMELISVVDAVNLADVVFTGLSSDYAYYVLEVMSYIPSNGTEAELTLLMSTDNGATFDTGSNYDTAVWLDGSGGFTASIGGNGVSGIALSIGTTADGTGAASSTLKLINPSDTTDYKAIHLHTVRQSPDGNFYMSTGGARWRNAGAYNAVKLATQAGGSIQSGKFFLYGVRARTTVPVVVQQVFTHIGGSSQPVTLPAAPTPGNTLVTIITGAGSSSQGDVPVPGADWNIVIWANNGVNPGNPGSGPAFQCFSLACKSVGTGDPATFDYNSVNGANVYLIEFQGRVAVDCTGVYALSSTTGQLVLSACGSPLADGMQIVALEEDSGNAFTFADGTITKLYESAAGGHYGVVGLLPAGYDQPILVNYTSTPVYPLGAVVSIANV